MKLTKLKILRFARYLACWLLCLAFVEVVVLPESLMAAQGEHHTMPLDAPLDGDGADEERLPVAGSHATVLTCTPLLQRKGHGCRGDDQTAPQSPDLGRLLRPPR
ncbi:MAG: hypothetical protein EXR77_18615 [Myxococcales bacterium]|nr:hypothetical protein [Myxococcales bacterium]